MPHSVFPQTDRDNRKITTKKMENGKDIPHPGQGGLHSVLSRYFSWKYHFIFIVCEEAPGICSHLLTLFSLILIILTLPVSLLMVVKVVQVSTDSFFLFSYSIAFFKTEKGTFFWSWSLLASKKGGGVQNFGMKWSLPSPRCCWWNQSKARARLIKFLG